MTHGVLIVEDEATLAKNIKTYTPAQRLQAEIAGSAEEGCCCSELQARRRAARLPPASMDGLTALTRFHALDPNLIVILTTGCGTARSRSRR